MHPNDERRKQLDKENQKLIDRLLEDSDNGEEEDIEEDEPGFSINAAHLQRRDTVKAAGALRRKISDKAELLKIQSSSGLQRKKSIINADGEEETIDYCDICYTNLIQIAPTRITDDITFEFSTCKHRYCRECCQE